MHMIQLASVASMLKFQSQLRNSNQNAAANDQQIKISKIAAVENLRISCSFRNGTYHFLKCSSSQS